MITNEPHAWMQNASRLFAFCDLNECFLSLDRDVRLRGSQFSCPLSSEPKMKRFFSVLLAVVITSSALFAAVDDEKPAAAAAKKKRKPVTMAVCPVAGKEMKIEDAKVVEYRKAKVYVCCGGCKSKMEKDSKPFAVKANQQLVATRQYRQTKCPISGGKIDKAQKTKIGKTMVRFCCPNCKKKADGAKGEDQLKLAFSDEAFKKAFVPVKKRGGKVQAKAAAEKTPSTDK